MFGLRFRGARYRYLALNGVAPWPAGRFFFVLERCAGSSLTRTTYETASAASPLGGAAANSTQKHEQHGERHTSLHHFTKGERNHGEVHGWSAPLRPNSAIGAVKPARKNPWLWDRKQRAMQSFEYRSIRYWSKDINGTLTGGEKNNFFNSRY